MGKRSSKKNRQSPENQRKKATAPPTTKSLNMQIKEFIKSSSPPKTRKVSETSLNKFDAFNHTSSHKLSHAISKELEKSTSSKQSTTSYPGQYNETYDDYEEFSYHPRRSSKEVLDFTSSRKSTRDNLNKSDEKDLGRRQYCKEDKGPKSDGSEGHHKRKDTDHRHCQCLSPK